MQVCQPVLTDHTATLGLHYPKRNILRFTSVRAKGFRSLIFVFAINFPTLSNDALDAQQVSSTVLERPTGRIQKHAATILWWLGASGDSTLSWLLHLHSGVAVQPVWSNLFRSFSYSLKFAFNFDIASSHFSALGSSHCQRDRKELNLLQLQSGKWSSKWVAGNCWEPTKTGEARLGCKACERGRNSQVITRLHPAFSVPAVFTLCRTLGTMPKTLLKSTCWIMWSNMVIINLSFGHDIVAWVMIAIYIWEVKMI